MAIQDSGKVTVTLNRTTVEKLRGEKGGMAWDAFMLDLIGGRRQGIKVKCVLCRNVVESADIDLSLSKFVKKLGWKEISIRGRLGSIGFLCDKCSKRWNNDAFS